MASKLPAVKNSSYTFRCVLFAQSDNQIKSNPTLAAGDWKVSIDGGAFANLATLPDVDPDSSVQVKVSLSADEMNGDEIMITAIDAAGAEWHSAAWVIHTAAQTFDTMDTNIDAILADTGTDGVVLANDAIAAAKIATGAITAAKFAAGAIDAAAIATDAIDADALKADAVTEIQSGLATAAALVTIDGIVDDILVDTGTTLPGTLSTIAGYIDTEVAAVLAAVDTEVAAILVDTGTDIPAQITALNNLSAAQVNAEVVDVLRTDTIPDSYAADGAQPTIAQAVLMMLQFLTERAVSSTTLTVKKPDGSTTAMTLTLDDASNPTSITRAS